MTVITFDTHQFISKLIAAGFEAKQAEAVSDAFKTAPKAKLTWPAPVICGKWSCV
ncbi:MAG TPA: hypothetical protein VIF37_19290 [Methylobacter sp.]|jgi:hypothetical protein